MGTKLTAVKATAVVAAVALGWVSTTIAQSSASAQSPSAAETIKARQQGLKKLGAAFKVVRDELRTDSPDISKLKSAAGDVTQAAGEIGTWFPPGTGPEAGAKTDAKPEVWSDAAAFGVAREAFVTEAKKWTQLANSTDVSAWKEASTALGQTCKGCHDKYRVKKE